MSWVSIKRHSLYQETGRPQTEWKKDKGCHHWDDKDIWILR
jgi:hypothetical protein